MSKKILVVGGGGREHALAWRLSLSESVDKVWIAPGNPGTAAEPGIENLPITDIEELAQFAKANGVSAQWFSANSKGACPACKGKGEIVPEIAFADPVTIVCEECGGRRFNPTALSYRLRGLNIEEVMALTVDRALSFFSEENILSPLRTLQEVGLGYMTLGQPTSTLSGGETQRLKLASELKKSGNLYILDEPTTGLHGRDVQTLLALLCRLVAQGNTVVVVEHRMELIAAADWIIDMGPGGGEHGGEVIFTGTPQKLIHCEASLTGQYLRTIIE